MESRSLDNLDSRLVLWRNTIQLFHESRHQGFVGPFKKAGFREYRPEPLLKTPEGDDGEPDIVSWNDKREWVVLELTLNSESKCDQLERYSRLDPRYLENLGVLSVTLPPDVICSRVDESDDGPFCSIIVKKSFRVFREDKLANTNLAAELKSLENTDLGKLPSLPISLLSESRGAELRRGIVDHILQLFQPESRGLSAEEIVDNALERLAPIVRVEKRINLIKRVRAEMDSLARRELSQYLLSDGAGVFRSKTPGNMDHYAARLRVSSILKEWAGTPSPYVSFAIESYRENEGPS